MIALDLGDKSALEQYEFTEKGNDIVELLEAYYNKPVPTENTTFVFQLPKELRSFQFVCPVQQ
jgi:hypothetical protein